MLSLQGSLKSKKFRKQTPPKMPKTRGFRGDKNKIQSSSSTSIVGTDIRMSNLDIRVSNLDIRMSTLDIHMSKVILEFGKNKTAKNSRLNVAFRMFFQNFDRPTG